MNRLYLIIILVCRLVSSHAQQSKLQTQLIVRDFPSATSSERCDIILKNPTNERVFVEGLLFDPPVFTVISPADSQSIIVHLTRLEHHIMNLGVAENTTDTLSCFPDMQSFTRQYLVQVIPKNVLELAPLDTLRYYVAQKLSVPIQLRLEWNGAKSNTFTILPSSMHDIDAWAFLLLKMRVITEFELLASLPFGPTFAGWNRSLNYTVSDEFLLLHGNSNLAFYLELDKVLTKHFSKTPSSKTKLNDAIRMCLIDTETDLIQFQSAQTENWKKMIIDDCLCTIDYFLDFIIGR